MRRGVTVMLVVGAAVVPATIATATVPPGGGGAGAGVQVVREQAETAAAEFLATEVGGGVSHVACETPSADAPGVTFYCFGVDGAGAPVLAVATINDYGSPEFSAARSGPTATTAATTTTSPVLRVVEGSGNQVVQVDPIRGPTILAVTHDGSGPFSVQPQQGGVPAGPPLMSVTGPWTGRYLVGLAAAVSGISVTSDGAWTLSIEQRSNALTLDPRAGVSGESPDVIAYDDAAAWTASVAYEGAGPLVVRAATVSGAQELVNQTGPFRGEVEVPAGPGFVTVDAAGPWSVRRPAASSPPTT